MNLMNQEITKKIFMYGLKLIKVLNIQYMIQNYLI